MQRLGHGDCDDGDPFVHPGAVDVPDPTYLDANCDGMDGDPAESVFVDPVGGSDSVTGTTQADPVWTLGTAFDRAATFDRTWLLLAGGATYNHSASFAEGVNVAGGYVASPVDPWARSEGVLPLVDVSSWGMMVGGWSTPVEWHQIHLRAASNTSTAASSTALLAVNVASLDARGLPGDRSGRGRWQWILQPWPRLERRKRWGGQQRLQSRRWFVRLGRVHRPLRLPRLPTTERGFGWLGLRYRDGWWVREVLLARSRREATRATMARVPTAATEEAVLLDAAARATWALQVAPARRVRRAHRALPTGSGRCTATHLRRVKAAVWALAAAAAAAAAAAVVVAGRGPTATPTAGLAAAAAVADVAAPVVRAETAVAPARRLCCSTLNVALVRTTVETGRGGDGGPGASGGYGGYGGTGGRGGSGESSIISEASGDGGTGGNGGTGGRGGHGGGGGGGPSVGVVCEGSSILSTDDVTYRIGDAGAGGSSAGSVGATGLRTSTHACG